MDVFEAIAKRHSYRGSFKPDPVPRADLTRIVQAGIQAPSGCNAQSTTFVIVDEEPLLHQIGEIVGKPFVRDARALILCIADPAPVFKDVSFEKEDCAAAVENMLLAITALGYATVWIDGYLRTEGRAEAIGQLVGVPEGRRVQVLLPVGRPAEMHQQKEKKPFAERAWFDRYDG